MTGGGQRPNTTKSRQIIMPVSSRGGHKNPKHNLLELGQRCTVTTHVDRVGLGVDASCLIGSLFCRTFCRAGHEADRSRRRHQERGEGGPWNQQSYRGCSKGLQAMSSPEPWASRRWLCSKSPHRRNSTPEHSNKGPLHAD